MSDSAPYSSFFIRPSWAGAALLLLLPLCGCAPAEKQAAGGQPSLATPPTYSGVIAALRPASSANDPTGAVAQIMSILGQPAAAASGTEIVIKLSDNSVKSIVQPSADGLSVGGKVMIAETPATSIQPY